MGIPHILLIHSSIDGHLSGFFPHFLVIMNNATMNVPVQFFSNILCLASFTQHSVFKIQQVFVQALILKWRGVKDTLQKSTCNRRYCCSHTLKTQSATLVLFHLYPHPHPPHCHGLFRTILQTSHFHLQNFCI